MKEPNSLLDLTVLVAAGCCNLNYSGTGGAGGEKLITTLAKHNILTYPAEGIRPVVKQNMSSDLEFKQKLQENFESGFEDIADRWLPKMWGFEPVGY